MSHTPPSELEELLGSTRQGDMQAAGRLHGLLYSELHRLASNLMKRQPGQTLQATALVHEAYVRLAAKDGGWNDRKHFMNSAARAMRSVLVDHARARIAHGTESRGEDDAALDAVVVSHEEHGLDLVALDRALERMQAFDARMARAVELRFFAGLPHEEAAELLGISKRSYQRQWELAREWLHKELGRDLG